MDKTNFAPPSEVLADGLEPDTSREYLLRHEGGFFAGRHLLVDIWDGINLSDAAVIDSALQRAAQRFGALLVDRVVADEVTGGTHGPGAQV